MPKKDDEERIERKPNLTNLKSLFLEIPNLLKRL